MIGVDDTSKCWWLDWKTWPSGEKPVALKIVKVTTLSIPCLI